MDAIEREILTSCCGGSGGAPKLKILLRCWFVRSLSNYMYVAVCSPSSDAPKRPPPLRSSHPISPAPPVLSIRREWEDAEEDSLAVQEFHAYDHGIGFPSL